MSGVARISEKLKMEPYVPPTTIHINMKKHPGMDVADVGKKIHFKGHGIVRSIRKDEHEHRMEIDVKKIHGAGKSSPPDMEEHD